MRTERRERNNKPYAGSDTSSSGRPWDGRRETVAHDGVFGHLEKAAVMLAYLLMDQGDWRSRSQLGALALWEALQD
jgi:hypothetical protein